MCCHFSALRRRDAPLLVGSNVEAGVTNLSASCKNHVFSFLPYVTLRLSADCSHIYGDCLPLIVWYMSSLLIILYSYVVSLCYIYAY